MRETGARRLCALVTHLPNESATWSHDGWGHAQELLALVAEQTDFYGRLTAQGLGWKLKGKPLEITRPGGEPEPQKEPETDPSKIGRFFGSLA